MSGQYKTAFIGAGNMGYLLLKSAVESNLFALNALTVFDIEAACRKRAAELKVDVKADINEINPETNLVFLCVKPSGVTAVLEILSGIIAADSIIVSIAAGVCLDTLKKGFKKRAGLVRIMPNTAARIGMMAAGVCYNDRVDDKFKDFLQSFLSGLGIVKEVQEQQMNAVTALSGSGPAYVFTFFQALVDGAVALGLPRKTAGELALQTISGSTELLKKSGEHPAVLADQVTSPGGTTARGLAALERMGFKTAVHSALSCAYGRAEELGE